MILAAETDASNIDPTPLNYSTGLVRFGDVTAPACAVADVGNFCSRTAVAAAVNRSS